MTIRLVFTLLMTLVATVFTTRARAQQAKHYVLKRDVFALSLEGTPVVRVLCTVRDEKSGASETLIWDPSDRNSNVRYALLPASGRTPTLSCRSLQTTIGGALVYYKATGNGPITLTLQPKDKSQAEDKEQAEDDLTVSFDPIEDEEKELVLSQRTGQVQTTRLRSLDPTTALVNDALTALAAIALDRAKTASKGYASNVIKNELCDKLTVGKVGESLPESGLKKALDSLRWPSNRRLLHNTCALIETLRLDELVSAKDAVWKAVGVDASALASEFLKITLNGSANTEQLGKLMQATSALIGSALTGSTTTERDAQVLLLGLGKVGLSYVDDRLQGDWRFLLELGMAVLEDCLRGSECSADELDRLLRQELKLAFGSSLDPSLVIAQWPELPALLGRAANVLRPPPGTDPRTTAANAVALMLDVAEHTVRTREEKEMTICLNHKAQEVLKDIAESLNEKLAPQGTARCESGGVRYRVGDFKAASLKKPAAGQGTSPENNQDAKKKLKMLEEVAQSAIDREKENAFALIGTLRAISTALSTGDVTTAIVEFERVFESAIVETCAKRPLCASDLKTLRLKRGFRVLAAVATYGASYRQPDGTKESAELERQRAEERRRAMESLVDSVTDRSDRHREWLFSLGANVALGPDWRLVKGDEDYLNKAPLSLRTGLAFQYLPGDHFWKAGFHGMISVLDLAQYATIGETKGSGAEPEPKDDTLPEPGVATALRLGAELGACFGDPAFPMTLTVQGGYIPRVDYGDNPRPEWTVGGGLGIFVPFLDFN